MSNTSAATIEKMVRVFMGLTKKAESPPTRGVNRDSGTDSANGGWLRRLVRRLGFKLPVRQAWGMKYHRLSAEERYAIAANTMNESERRPGIRVPF